MNNDKSLSAILAMMKDDLKGFVETRFQILKAEISEKIARWKPAVLVLVVSLFVASTAWIALTFAAIALVRAWFEPSPYAWALGGLIVAICYMVIALVTGWLGYKELSAVSLKPERTVKVLQDDRLWIEQERRTA